MGVVFDPKEASDIAIKYCHFDFAQNVLPMATFYIYQMDDCLKKLSKMHPK